MKLKSIVRIAVLALPLVLVSCKSHKKVVDATPTIAQRQATDFLGQVRENQQTAKFITSKVKFSVEVGPQKLTLTVQFSENIKNLASSCARATGCVRRPVRWESTSAISRTRSGKKTLHCDGS